MPECTVPECHNPGRSSRAIYCEKHYYRLRRNGTLTAKPWTRRDKPCLAEGCEKLGDRGGWCSLHAGRVQRHGSPDIVIHQRDRANPRSDAHYAWTGEQASYSAAHQRVRKVRGRASSHTCVACGAPARQWAYNHSAADERVSPEGLPYSPDPAQYDPKCVSCHKRADLAWLARGAA